MSHCARRLKLEIAYDGTAYHGWQSQERLPTIQGTLQETLARIVGHSVNILSSGRTDAGVHAIKQVATFSTTSPREPEVIQRSLNATLPHDIRIRSATEVPWTFHPIRDIVAKRYRYLIDDGRPFFPFLRHYSWVHIKPLDEQLMREAATFFVGTHDFAAFETQGSPRESTVRTVTDVSVTRINTFDFWGQRHFAALSESLLVIEVEANGFLYNMVRTMVGTLAFLGSRDARRPTSRAKSLTPAWVGDLLTSRDRTQAGQTAPAQGLYMLDVRYPDETPRHIR